MSEVDLEAMLGSTHARVGVIMGSQSDWDTMREACNILDQFGVPYEARVVSAHRTPKWMVQYAEKAAERGLQILIAGAGGAAHLPGMVASCTTLPVFGVPVQSKALSGLDSLLSIVQMPGGIPVGTLAIGVAGAKNAGHVFFTNLRAQETQAHSVCPFLLEKKKLINSQLAAIAQSRLRYTRCQDSPIL